MLGQHEELIQILYCGFASARHVRMFLSSYHVAYRDFSTPIASSLLLVLLFPESRALGHD